MAFICTCMCAFRLLAAATLDCGGLVHPSSPFASHLPFKVICLLSAKDDFLQRCGSPLPRRALRDPECAGRRIDLTDQVQWKLLSLRLRAVSKQKLTKSFARLRMIRGRKKQQQPFPTDRGPRGARTSATCNNNPAATRTKGRGPQSFSRTTWLHLVLPLVPLAGFAGARVAEATQAEDKLVVHEAQAAGHAGAGIGPPVGGAHGDEAVRTAAGEA